MAKRPQSVTVELLQQDIDTLRAALHVITLTPHIADYLLKNDPKALQQAHDAIRTTDNAK
jgi:hypothetical protein